MTTEVSPPDTIRHLYPHFTRGSSWVEGGVPVIVKGEGCYVYDSSGQRYLDGLSGLFCVNMGHGRQDIARAGAKQLETLAYWTNWSSAHPAAMEASELIASLAPPEMNSVFFVNSGSEAVESAIKIARQFHRENGEPSRVKILARDMAYHGTTMGALAVTGIEKYRLPFEPLMPGVFHFPNTLGEKLQPGESASDLPSLQALSSLIEREGAETIAAIFAEPVQNSRGVLVPPEGYWSELRSICDRNGILLVADEVITGFCRVGSWFASYDYGARPDIITFAKGSTSGYAPLGGLVLADKVADTVLNRGTGSFVHGSTWGGHPVATAIAIANITAMKKERVLNNVLDLQAFIQSGLDRIRDDHKSIREWRGTGFFYAIEFMRDRESGKDLTPEQSVALLREVMPAALKKANLITRPDDRGATMLTIAPPLVADATVLDELLEGVEVVAKAVDDFLAKS
ncbi:MAG: aminotransferase class III-fold pyridoxal phosphate-dependent enzyme [Microbacteriaceae bacterium]|nr:aminotransferase class III-fold pyridoxal phosphate-dependent enzyme [Cryobacterium sp.]MCC6376875.1 aminotransferase class III-fold pyridoxal phosphate-dependent enzyme [Microbacteriaceae bacterium]